ncbi:hypothetical protein [Methanovulcanius yangii]|uniref:hypothetical protein n=1 Tax=Methanovulcanius yangii TaxID=1789227 RepID=UPI0029CA2485|nr:hypothetical protein [Methanovulcanius yangii]
MYSSNQQKIAERIDPETLKSNWKDWEWQIGHSIRDIDTVERLLGIQFPADRREELEETIARFPLCITPYYLSLIEAGDYDNDPVFMQAFPSISELIVEEYDLPDPLAEDADSPVPCITHRYIWSVFFRMDSRRRMVARIPSSTRPVSKWASLMIRPA